MAEGKRLTKKTNIPKSISEIYEEFQKYNAIKNLSEHTITYYYWNLKHLFDYLNEQGISNIRNITSDTIDNFTLWLKKQYDNSITINTYLTPLLVERGVRFGYACSHSFTSVYSLEAIISTIRCVAKSTIRVPYDSRFFSAKSSMHICVISFLLMAGFSFF